jgi:hypothetical protein
MHLSWLQAVSYVSRRRLDADGLDLDATASCSHLLIHLSCLLQAVSYVSRRRLDADDFDRALFNHAKMCASCSHLLMLLLHAMAAGCVVCEQAQAGRGRL